MNIPIELGKDSSWLNPVRIDAAARARHTYVSGQTGTGKSALLLNIAAQVASSGGFAFIDPHGDNAQELLSRIPACRAHELVYIDLTDLAAPVGLNFLHDIQPDKRSAAADNIVSTFVHIFGREAVGDRSQAVLRNSLLALMERNNESLLSVIQLLRSESFRSSVIAKLRDPLIRSYWQDEFANYDGRYREQVVAPILNKLDACLSHVALRHILAQPTSSVNLRTMMDEGRILVVNLRKGSVGEQASRFCGALIFSALTSAALSRDDIPEDDRRPFDVIVDEFHSVITTDFATVLSELRKYGLQLTLANQYLEQIPDDIRPAIFGNAGTFIAFRPGYDDAIELNKQFQGKAPSHFLDLPNFRAWVRPLVNGVPGSPIHIQTHPPRPPINRHPEKLIANSQVRFGRRRSDIERHVERTLQS